MNLYMIYENRPKATTSPTNSTTCISAYSCMGVESLWVIKLSLANPVCAKHTLVWQLFIVMKICYVGGFYTTHRSHVFPITNRLVIPNSVKSVTTWKGSTLQDLNPHQTDHPPLILLYTFAISLLHIRENHSYSHNHSLTLSHTLSPKEFLFHFH